MSIADKITSITGHLTDDYTALEQLGVSVEDRNIENIKDMANQIYAKFPKTDYAEGSNITLSNCLKGKLDYEDDKVGYGDTLQEGEPTPTTPIPIQVVTGEQEVVVRGKNLFTTANVGTWTKRSNALTISYNGINKIELSTGTSTYGYGYSAIAEYPAKIGKKYAISYKVSNKTNSNTADSNHILLNATQPSLTGSPAGSNVVVATGNTIWLFVLLAKVLTETSENATVTLSDIQIEEIANEETQGTDFEPYITPITKQLSLGNKELFEDSFIDRDNNGDFYFNDIYIKVNLKDVSDRVINTDSTNTTRVLFRNTTSSTFVQTTLNKCNRLQYSTNWSIDEEGFYCANNSSNIAIRMNKTTIGTTDEQISTYLNNNETYVVGKLTSVVRTPITDTTLINQLEDIYNMQSVNGTTIVEINGNLPMIIKCRALKGE